MRVLLAPDSFKGCLSSVEVCKAMAEGIKKFDDTIEVIQFPSSDGGEGFCDCMLNIYNGDRIKREVTYPLGNKGSAEYVYNQITKTAYIELASAAGLHLIPKEERNIWSATTYGVGELIKDAIDNGAKNIVVGLGGSATNDCGIGILSALGIKFYDSEGELLPPIPESLDKISYVDKTNFSIGDAHVVAACDVKNPLCGDKGAAAVFARQKGATAEDIIGLDKAAYSFANALNIDTAGISYGAAGGAGAALIGVMNATCVSGASLLSESSKFIDSLQTADILITGEGNTDRQTVYGKLISVIIKKAKHMNVPSVILSGGLSDGYESLYDLGAIGIFSLRDDEHDLSYCISHAYQLLVDKTYSIMKKI